MNALIVNLLEWLNTHLIAYELSEQILTITHFGKCLVLLNNDQTLWGDTLLPIVNEKDSKILENTSVDYYVYKFGACWYYCKPSDEEFKLNILRNVGVCSLGQYDWPYLGIHGQYELMSGTGSYKDYVKKAKWFGINTLAICEKNSLAGVLKFQLECQKEEINAILGETITVILTSERLSYDVKLYVIDQEGWSNLTMLNSLINVVNKSKSIEINDLREYNQGLLCVLNPLQLTTLPKAIIENILTEYKVIFKKRVFWQFEPTIIEDNFLDEQFLQLIKNNFLNRRISVLPICDTYYLEQWDQEIRKVLLSMSGQKDIILQSSQHFKHWGDIVKHVDDLFSLFEEKKAFLQECMENLKLFEKLCDFKIDTNQLHLPEFKLEEDIKKKYSVETNEELFFLLIEEGMERFQLFDKNEYNERLEREIELIHKGGYENYFLILWDVIRFCNENNILVGPGRGSAAGCLVSYLMGITRIDPIKYNLYFERFLTEGRIGKSLPDIDTDLDSERRDEVKFYLEQKYGEDKVCSVGTYSTFQIKAAIKDFARLKGVSPQEVIYLNAMLEDLPPDKDDKIEDLFKIASKNRVVKSFIEKYPEIIEYIRIVIAGPKLTSIHASATLILPEDMSIYDTLPIRMGTVGDKEFLTTEWEGTDLEKAGYLKEDLLAIRQMTKFRKILDLIDENIDIYDLPLNDDNVYNLFRNGWNGDVFHLGSKTLTQFSKIVQPTQFSDLVAMIALVRPGPMENGYHLEWVARRNGDKQVVQYSGTEGLLDETYGLCCYQEDIMRVCNELGEFTLAETDDIRKAMGKKDIKDLPKYKKIFIQNTVNKGYSEREMIDLWDAMEKFAGYAFNKSHATSYVMNAYICQWLKYYYPVQYWTVAFDFARDFETIARYIAEINISGQIKIKGPDINNSAVVFKSDINKREIYWSLTSIFGVAEIASTSLLKERDVNGPYFSFEEFLNRVSPKEVKVNKTAIENLIFAGAFDDIEHITNICDRLRLIEQYRAFINYKVPKTNKDDLINKAIETALVSQEWWWKLLQKKYSGYATFDFENYIDRKNPSFKKLGYVDGETVLNTQNDSYFSVKSDVITAGIVQEVEMKSDSKGDDFCRILIENNYNFFWVYFRGKDVFKKFQTYIESCGKKGSMLIVKGILSYNKFLKQGTLQTVDDCDVDFLTIE